jgi:hypothetical protein
MAINSSIGSLCNNSDDLPSSQNSSQGSSYQNWTVDKINVLQSNIATTKLRLDHSKESTNTKISDLQTSLQTGFTRQISALEPKFDLKSDTFSREIRHSISELKTELIQNISELRAESRQNISDIIKEVHQHEVRLVWGLFFTTSSIILTISYLLIIYSS